MKKIDCKEIEINSPKSNHYLNQNEFCRLHYWASMLPCAISDFVSAFLPNQQLEYFGEAFESSYDRVYLLFYSRNHSLFLLMLPPPCCCVLDFCSSSILRFIEVTSRNTGAFFRRSGSAINRILLPLRYTLGNFDICPFFAVRNTSDNVIFIVSSALNNRPL